MHAILSVLLPIFGLILIGFVAARQNWLGQGATDILNRFVIRLALPAELFLSTAQVTRAQIDHPGFAVAFTLATLATFALGWMFDWFRPADRMHRLSGAAIEGLTAGYANTAFMGLPLCLGLFGPSALPAVVIATLVTVCGLFAVAIALVELEELAGRSTLQLLARVGLALLRNPLVFSPLAGAAVNLSGLGLPAAAQQLASLLGAATSPCALVTIGLFLAETSGRSAPLGAVARVVGLKMLVQPALTALLVFGVFRIDPAWANQALVLSALPTGTGPFMLARLYQREADVASRAILTSTLLSVVSISAIMAWIAAH
ncbi:AEC family transporter [Nguyenibacter vanlangensis]|uniref:AEC family transporter n=2 Tax=Nguyenibacter vanlangensis TaxID=1216886 RepID=A0ABZ3D8T9_9PROT